MSTLDIIGWIGCISFAVSSVPQTIKSFKDGHSNGIASGMILLWLLGEFAMLTYTVIKYTDVALLTNYVLNLVFIAPIAWYKVFPRKINVK